MKQKFKTLEREQIKRRLNWLSSHQNELSRPKEGWIKALRTTLGMTASYVAKKIGVSEPRIYELEKAEINDSTTLKSMRVLAEAMGCRLEYAFIPCEPIDLFLKKRAHTVALESISYISHQMELEGQGLEKKETKEQIEKLVEELLKNPKKLWNYEI